MGALEQVTQMQQQGLDDNQIASALQEQGISPQEINDALGQSQIKSAISQENAGQTQEYAPAPGEGEQQYYQEAPQSYGYAPSAATDTESMIEISEQVFADKTKEIEKRLNKEEEFSNLTKVRLENMEQRLQRLEQMFDKLQLEVLGKIGSVVSGVRSNKKEMTMMQNSFRKVVSKRRTTKHKKTSKKKK